jgi:hypothetical protein
MASRKRRRDADDDKALYWRAHELAHGPALLERWDSLDFELLGSVIRALDTAGATGNLEARLGRIVRQVRRLLGR